MSALNRWYLRCTTCLAVSAVEETPNLGDWTCGICRGRFENLGRVQRDRLINESHQSICDDRCTSARGPLCNCKCGGKYHGSHMVVKVVTDAGPIPTITPRAGREQARLNAAEFKQLCNAALALLDPLRASKTRGYLPSGEYARMVRLDRALRTAHAARTHASRVKTLRAVVGDLRVSDPIAAVAVETHTTIATAQPIADVPFSLQPTSATRAATQTTLF